MARKEWIPRPDRFFAYSGPPSFIMTWNRANSAPTISAGSGPVPSTSPTNQGCRGESGLTMMVGGRPSGGWRRHQLPQDMCMGKKLIPQAGTEAKG